KKTVASRAVGRGLAKVEPTSPNTLIAYSAKAGSTALDGDAKNSPFTMALAKHLTTPGLDVRRAFGFVRDDVLKNTGNRQEPFVYGSLGGDDVPLVPAKAAPPATAAPSAPAFSPQAEARLAEQERARLAAQGAQAAQQAKAEADAKAAEQARIAAEKARQAAAEQA